MRNNQGPWQGRQPSGPQRPPGTPPRQSREDSSKERVKELLRNSERAAYLMTEKPGPGFLDADARAQAERLAGLAASQLRRFYAMVTGFKRRLELDEERIGENEVQAQMAYLKAAAAYAVMRRQPDELVRFFTIHANSVRTREQYRTFCRHFEAVVAYHKVFGTERRD
jgi:CRISPR-associated protein Csm2